MQQQQLQQFQQQQLQQQLYQQQAPSPQQAQPQHHHHHSSPRICISCHSSQSPCWRPSWSLTEGQLCNSCGLRYKKTKARCLNPDCLRIPAKGEWTLMKNKGKVLIEATGNMSYKCLHCDGEVAVDES
ncbi:unnamed protein product [Ambrosiozyma monospora]|uniref:Unnamed protein product n=1 Tax=Ambrosiozyma monospora TaxID=43982 RepID=A0ACB5UAB4_AMBMO|nr:unnamed protein product [Ambrosiozyma monospora]